MRFWDSSAIIPILIPEPETTKAVNLHQKDPVMIVWALTATEIHSAVHRKLRSGELKTEEFTSFWEHLELLKEGWNEIFQIETVRSRANRLLAVHPLRAADALQLAAALIAFEDHPEGQEFVSFDDVLTSAAQREGFMSPSGNP